MSVHRDVNYDDKSDICWALSSYKDRILIFLLPFFPDFTDSLIELLWRLLCHNKIKFYISRFQDVNVNKISIAFNIPLLSEYICGNKLLISSPRINTNSIKLKTIILLQIVLQQDFTKKQLPEQIQTQSASTNQEAFHFQSAIYFFEPCYNTKRMWENFKRLSRESHTPTSVSL